jgi:hypothetical protein
MHIFVVIPAAYMKSILLFIKLFVYGAQDKI